MRKIIVIILMFFVTFIFVGCDKNQRPENHFLFATWAAGQELKEFNAIVKQVNEEANGEFVIETLSIPSDYYIKVSSMIAAKNSPDFFWLTQELISKYAELGVIADLTNQFNASTEIRPADFYEGVLASATYKDKYWGLPWIANPLIVYYNKDLFQSAGITPPSATDDWTWEEFIDICRNLKGTPNYKGEEIYATVVDGWPNIETFIWSGGGDILSADGKTVLIDSEASLSGLGNLHTIISENLTPPYSSISSLGSNNVWFEKQRVAMFMGGAQDNFEYKISLMNEDDRFELGYAPMPVAADGSPWAFDWTASTVVAKKLEGNALAYKALEAMTKGFFKWKIASPIVGETENIATIQPLKAQALETIEYTLDYARSANYTPEWSDINDMLWYDLYIKMLTDPNFNYQSEARGIAAEAREIIGR
ncbi:MAG: extracellular solute-binding protein [Acholeplasmataceae bacterium]|jgi:multiple sugar transport system substrate-binding protein|nr:extracellular solute-binding protein [Acholeplasmataceae bacterium]